MAPGSRNFDWSQHGNPAPDDQPVNAKKLWYLSLFSHRLRDDTENQRVAEGSRRAANLFSPGCDSKD